MFSIKLAVSDNIEKLKDSILSLSNESINDVLMEICDELHHYQETIVFSVSGFDIDWLNIDIDPDLCMLMIDMPYLVNFLKNKDLPKYEFGFPEQHIHKIFIAVHTPDGLKFSCTDCLDESPAKIDEFMQTSDFINLLRELVKNIKLALDRVCPVAYENIFFQEWLQQVQI